MLCEMRILAKRRTSFSQRRSLQTKGKWPFSQRTPGSFSRQFRISEAKGDKPQSRLFLEWHSILQWSALPLILFRSRKFSGFDATLP